MYKQFVLATGALLLGSAIVAPAFGQPVHAQPASLMIYPLFDSTPSRGTLITVTNIYDNRMSCGNGFRQGDVRIHYTYIDGATWNEFDTDEDLTPGDTLTVFADQHDPEQEVGFLWVEARDPESGAAIDFDFLIGSAIIVDMGVDFLWSYTPYPFRANPSNNARIPTDVDACGRFWTDVAPTANNFADFDGNEYDFFPAALYLDNFFAETAVFQNELTLMTPWFDPRGLDDVNVQFGIWNNDERRFSRNYPFQCWTRISLHDVSNVVLDANLGGNGELQYLGSPVHTGWIEMLANAPILGVYMHRIVGGSFAAGRELQFDRQFPYQGAGPNLDPVQLERFDLP